MDRQPTLPQVAAPVHRFALVARDGYPLAATCYRPAREPRAEVLLCSATAVRQGFYAAFARHLAARGLRVWTFDYRGIGQSRPAALHQLRATMRDWAELDAEAMIDHVAHEAAGRPLYLVGHSFGGQLLGLIGAPERFAGAVLIASQLGYVGHWPAASRWALRLLWGAAVPALVAARGYVPGRLGLGGNDLPGGVASQWARWCRDPRYLLGEVPGAAAAFAAVRGPLLAYSFADDWMAPRPAVEALLATFRGAEVCHRHIDPRREGGAAVGHFGFFRQEAGGHLWPQVTAFLGAGARAPGEPVTPCHVAMQEVMADLAYGRA